MNSKILIWNTFPLLERMGGPSTYLFNLKNYFSENNANVVFLGDFLCQLKNELPNNNQPILSKKFKKIIPISIKNIIRINQNLVEQINILDKPFKLPENIDLKDFSVIHFHTSFDLFQALDLLKNFKGTVIFTPHTPRACYLENIGDSLKLWQVKKTTVSQLKKIDLLAFKRADILMFPCLEAMEPYHETWDEFKDIVTSKRIEFVPTGVGLKKSNLTKKEVRDKYNIPQDAFVICYLGRHNYIKGFDLLKQFGKIILKKHKNVYFLNAGIESPLRGLKHKRWIEVGWTNDPFALLNASDLFTLANKMTYFDLVLLEVISNGKLSLVSSTGGNNFFKKFDLPNLVFFNKNNVEDMLYKFEDIFSNQKHFCTKENEMLKIYEENFTLNVFGRNYLNFYNNVINSK